MRTKVITVLSAITFYAILVYVCVLDANNYQFLMRKLTIVLGFYSHWVFVLWYIRFIMYMLLGAGYGFVIHTIPKLKIPGKWVFNWKKAMLWAVFPVCMPIWFTLYYTGTIDFMPVHMLHSLPNIPLYNLVGFIFGSSLLSCLKKEAI